MAFNKDLKLKNPMVEDYGSSLEEAFNKGMNATRKPDRVKLLMYKQIHDALIVKHDIEHEVSRIQGKLELIHELFNMAALTNEKDKLESELVIAEVKMSDVKVPYIDWYELGQDLAMAFNRDLKLKSPIVEEFGSSLEEAFNNGKIETKEPYRAILSMYKDHLQATIAKHDEELEVYRVLGKLELLKEHFNMEAMIDKKEKLESELVLAQAKMDEVRVPYIDWFKLGEPQMFD